MKKSYLLVIIAILLVSKGFSQTPPQNKKIVNFLNTVIGKKVDRGECWDLANAALSASDSYFDRSSKKSIYIYGEPINPDKDQIYPGDLIQFKNVKLKYTKDNVEYREQMSHHTAIVYKVHGPGNFEIAHQNTSFSGKKVGVSALKLQDVEKGKLSFYRPIANN